MQEAIGPKLRQRRLRLGLSQNDLASRAQISKPYLSLIENGRTANPPSDEKLRRLEQALNFEAGELIVLAHLQRTPGDVLAVLTELMQRTSADVPGSADPSPRDLLRAVFERSMGLAAQRKPDATHELDSL